MEKYKKITIYTDGGSRGNPGPAAYGVVVKENNTLIKELTEFLGVKTNNEAEYEGVLVALSWLLGQKEKIAFPVTLFSDSTLVVNQLMGRFKIKQPHIAAYVLKVKKIEQSLLGKIMYTAIPREKNTEADFLVNKTLDSSIF